MDPSSDSLKRELDSLEALCGGRAFPGAAACLTGLERGLERYVEHDGQLRPCNVTSEVLWQVFGRLKAAVAAQNLDAVLTASSDLRMELVALERARQAA
jgi:hypothetical protein